jgi:hypothetical protein
LHHANIFLKRKRLGSDKTQTHQPRKVHRVRFRVGVTRAGVRVRVRIRVKVREEMKDKRTEQNQREQNKTIKKKNCEGFTLFLYLY